MQFCPTCGAAVRIVPGSKIAGTEQPPKYTALDESEMARTVFRFREMVRTMQETMASDQLTANTKLEMIASDIQRVLVDLPPAEPPPPPAKKFEPKKKSPTKEEVMKKLLPPTEVDDEDDEDDPVGLDKLADDLLKKSQMSEGPST